MAQPTPRDVHVDSALSNISMAYMNEAYIADSIFPVIPVDKISDYYYTWDKEFWFRDHVKARGPGSRYAEGGLGLSDTQYICVNKGLSFPLPRETIANQDQAVDLEKTGARWLADQFLLHREISLATKVFGATAWTSSTTLAGINKWSDYANSDPVKDIETAKTAIRKLTGHSPNTMLMGEEVWDKLKYHPDLLDVYKFTEKAILTPAMIGTMFEIPKVIVGNAIKNTAGEADTFVGAYVWGKYCLLAYVAPNPGLLVPSAGYQFLWKGAGGLTTQIQKVPEDLRNRDVLLADQAFDQKVTAADCGYEIISPV